MRLAFRSISHFTIKAVFAVSLDQDQTSKMTPFDGSGKENIWKHCGKRRNCLYKQFLLFPQCFFTQKWSFLLHLFCCLQLLSIWSGWSKILSCGKELKGPLKILREKEKMVITSILSTAKSFKLDWSKISLFGKELNFRLFGLELTINSLEFYRSWKLALYLPTILKNILSLFLWLFMPFHQ